MKKLLITTLFFCASLCVLSITAYGQKKLAKPVEKPSMAGKILRGTGIATFVVVKSAAKMSYDTAKVTGKYMIKPAAEHILKPLLVKVVPKATVFTLKYGAKAAIKLLPTALKLSLL